MPAAGPVRAPVRTRALGRAWLALCAALALHVTDEALTGLRPSRMLELIGDTGPRADARFPNPCAVCLPVPKAVIRSR
jgi:hypothetical protein